MMTPERCFNIAGRKPRSKRTAEKRFSSNSCCQISSLSASAPPLGGGTADAVDQNIEAAEPVESCLDDMFCSWARAGVRLNELFCIAAFRDGSGRREHQPSAGYQPIHNRLANPLGATGDEDSFTGEFVSVGNDL